MTQNKLNRFFYWGFRKLYQLLCGVKTGVYIQNYDHIHIGHNVIIASGVQIIARNHNLYDHTKKEKWEDVYVDDNSWIGANAIILPGVHLGPHTVVGAGSVITKSYPDGYCVLAGNPAKIIEDLSDKKHVKTLKNNLKP